MPPSLTEYDLKSALPDLVTPHRFRTLRSGAVIRRDNWGIPHIKAEDEYDRFFAHGFAAAQDRLFQMDFDRLRAVGRAAEYLGPSAREQDVYMRRRQLGRVSKLDYTLASACARSALEAYADGINAFIESTRTLPVEYRLLSAEPERWEPWHCVAVYKVRNSAEGSFQGKLWLSRLAAVIGPAQAAKLSPGYPTGSLLTVPPDGRYRGAVLDAVEELHTIVNASSMLNDAQAGSNGWAISGGHTESGLPLVAGDSHRGLEVPNIYYQVHLIGTDYSVVGYTIPGFPIPLHFCHNEFIGWGMTASGTDTQDLFIERFRLSEGHLEYLFRDEWLRASTRVETHRARGTDEGRIEIVETHHGPVIAGDPRRGAAITLSDPGSKEGTPWIDAAYRAVKAASADELEEALEGWTDRVNNYVYADVHGNFGYTLRGRIPIRARVNGWGPVPGWTGMHEWTGWIPAGELPRSRNPQIGFVVSCNQRVVDEQYPYYLTHFGNSGYRAERIASRIAHLKEVQARSSRGASVAEMASIHADLISIPAQAMQKALTGSGAFAEKVMEAARALLHWDCTVTSDSTAAALYEATAEKLAEHLIKSHYGSLAGELLNSSEVGAEEHWLRHLKAALVTALEQRDASWLPSGQSWTSLLSTSIESAVLELESRLGADHSKWRWGDLHRTDHQHPLAAAFPEAAASLNPPRVEVPGDYDTPFVTGSRIGKGFIVHFGSINRYIHDPSHWSNGRWIVPLGSSGHPGSIHYADQQRLWSKAEAIPQLWDWDEIGRNAGSEQLLLRTSSGDSVEADFLEWAKSSAVPILITPGGPWPDLASLGRMIGNAQVVALGEGVHGAAEPLELRNRIFEYLVHECGFTAIALESGLVEGRVIHDYVRGADGDPATVLSRGISWTFDRFPQNRDLVRWLRRHNADRARKVNFYGFDVSGSPGNPNATRGVDTALLEALRYLESVDPIAAAGFHSRLDALLGDLRFDLNCNPASPGYHRLDAAARDALTAAIADLILLFERKEAEYATATTVTDYEWAYRATVGARQVDNELRQVPSGWLPSSEAFPSEETRFLLTLGDVRDRDQSDNLDWILGREGPSGRVLVFAHRYHLSASPVTRSFQLSGRVETYSHEMAGTYLKRRLGERLITICNVIGRGEINRRGIREQVERAPPDSIDGFAAAVGMPRFLLDLRAAPASVARWLHRVRSRDHHGSTFELPVGQAFDILLYVDEVSPACPKSD